MDYVSFCSDPVILSSRPLLPSSMSNYCWARPWLSRAEFQFKARLRGKIIRIDLDKENLVSVAFKGTYIHNKMQFLSENLKS